MFISTYSGPGIVLGIRDERVKKRDKSDFMKKVPTHKQEKYISMYITCVLNPNQE